MVNIKEAKEVARRDIRVILRDVTLTRKQENAIIRSLVEFCMEVANC